MRNEPKGDDGESTKETQAAHSQRVAHPRAGRLSWQDAVSSVAASASPPFLCARLAAPVSLATFCLSPRISQALDLRPTILLASSSPASLYFAHIRTPSCLACRDGRGSTAHWASHSAPFHSLFAAADHLGTGGGSGRKRGGREEEEEEEGGERERQNGEIAKKAVLARAPPFSPDLLSSSFGVGYTPKTRNIDRSIEPSGIHGKTGCVGEGERESGKVGERKSSRVYETQRKGDQPLLRSYLSVLSLSLFLSPRVAFIKEDQPRESGRVPQLFVRLSTSPPFTAGVGFLSSCFFYHTSQALTLDSSCLPFPFLASSP